MNHFNSTIKHKTCKCGCGLLPTLGWDGWKMAHAPQELKDKQTKKQIETRNRQNKARLSKKLHEAGNVSKKEIKASHKPDNKKLGVKRTVLSIADNVFSKWVKKRDADKDGFITCPCCQKRFHGEHKNESGEPVVNTMHFVKRSVYSLRFDERNVWAGCCYCNSKQHQNPKGKEYTAFKDFLTLRLGLGIVWQMESQNRSINKITEGDLKEIILKYKR